MTTANYKNSCIITGRGIVSAIGVGKSSFKSGLLSSKQSFALMNRPHRQHSTSRFVGAEISDASLSSKLGSYADKMNTLSLTSQAAVVAVDEAWEEANINTRYPDRKKIGIIIGGTNTQQRSGIALMDKYAGKPEYLSPHYGFTYLDTDLLGVLTESFGIQGESYVLGGASASGQMAIIHAARMVKSGMVDVAIAVGALTDLSFWEFQGLTAMGAMAECYQDELPEMMCRPFDKSHHGFVYGEGCAAVVIEKKHHRADELDFAVELKSWDISIDGNRNPNPSEEGQVKAINTTLETSGVTAAEIDYINTHGTASVIGDQTEINTIKAAGCTSAALNSTKSLTGHCMAAAGVVECVATTLQMQHGFCHATRNLVNPIDSSLPWVMGSAQTLNINHALNLSYGFSGINTALLLTLIK